MVEVNRIYEKKKETNRKMGLKPTQYHSFQATHEFKWAEKMTHK